MSRSITDLLAVLDGIDVPDQWDDIVGRADDPEYSNQAPHSSPTVDADRAAADRQRTVGRAVALAEVPDGDESEVRGRGWLVGVLAVAATVVLVVGGLVWLSGSDDKLRQIDEPAVTIVATSTTTTTPPAPDDVTIETDSFAPFVSGLGLDDGERNSFAVSSQEFSFGATTLTVWDGSLSVDWRGVVASVVDEDTRLRIENRPPALRNEVGYEWVAQEGVLDFFWWQSKESFAQLTLDFSGSIDDWAVDVIDAATGEAVGSLEGSLPGLDTDEILTYLTGIGRVGWVFVAGEDEQIPVTPPWLQYFEEGERSEFVVVGDRIVAFVVTEPRGPGQMTIWSSTDGEQWNDLGPAPWPGRRYALDQLLERDGELLALVVGDEVGDDEGVWEPGDPEDPGTPRYWSSPDGAVWAELTAQEWDEKSGGVQRTIFPEERDGPDASVIDYFDAVAASGTPIPDDMLVIQPALGPEPQFDTSTLGRQIPLELAEPDVSVVGGIGVDWNDPTSRPAEPILYVGRIEDPFESDFVVYASADGLCQLLVSLGGVCQRTELDPVKPFQDLGAQDLIVMFVPLDAAAVVLTLDDDEPMWQRPIGGWALMPGQIHPTTRYTLEIYDEAGAIIDDHSR
jgi:hypothetical protein